MTDARITADEVLAFDLYGTLVDPAAISPALGERLPGDDAASLARLWRATQIDYAFRLTIMGRYEDFAWVTARALDFALEVYGHVLSAAYRRELLDRYNGLESFPDVQPGLQALQEKGIGMMVLSNGSSHMIRECLQRSGLESYFDSWMSVDTVRAYKPDPRVYRHAAEVARRPIADIRLVSSNPFDIVGAAATGMKTAWVNRSGKPFDTMATPPNLVVSRIADLHVELGSAGAG